MKYYYALHGDKNKKDFDYKSGYGLSGARVGDLYNIEKGDKVFIIQRIKTNENYKLCGLFEVIGHYIDEKNTKSPNRLKFRAPDDEHLNKFIELDEDVLSKSLPKLDTPYNWNNFKRHFCKQGQSLKKPLSEKVSRVLLDVLKNNLNTEIQSTEIQSKDRTLEKLNEEFEDAVKQSRGSSKEARQERLKKAPARLEYISREVLVYPRNPDVVAEVLERANGICECCKKPAPFKRKKKQNKDKLEGYLEVHHKIFLSQGGNDTVENAEALCPNCHREKHYG
ncbi:HNH endonuclease [Proteus terrae]|uniref:HNH endonuclease n=1 Tax=Proteus terrae TaxID=1574161 RepID=UPI0029E68CAD